MIWIFLGAAAVLVAGYRAYDNIRRCGYDVRRDYRYDVSNAPELEAAIEGNTVRFAHTAVQTVLVEVEMAASFWGLWRRPGVDVRSGTRVSRHVFEHGGRGRRFLVVDAEASRLECSPRTLRRFRIVGVRALALPELSSGLLVLSPHPDDAEIAAFGLYAAAAAKAAVVTVTAGDGGKRPYKTLIGDETAAYELKAQMRVGDSLCVPRLGGVAAERIVNLGYSDGTLAAMYRRPDTPVAAPKTTIGSPQRYRRLNSGTVALPPRETATWNGLVDDLCRLLRTFDPQTLVLPFPRFDRAPDHRYATLAMIEAILREERTQMTLLLYTNHLPENELYPYGPAGTAVDLPPSLNAKVSLLPVSFPLEASMQARKLLALEAMSVLRPDPSWTTPSGMAALGCKAAVNLLKGKDKSYFRRAVRANELFFSLHASALHSPQTLASLFPEGFFDNASQPATTAAGEKASSAAE